MGDGNQQTRLQIDGGGCSGFEYKFEAERADALTDDETTPTGPTILSCCGRPVAGIVRGATIDFQQEMIRSAFAVVDNPNSSSRGVAGEAALKPRATRPPHRSGHALRR